MELLRIDAESPPGDLVSYVITQVKAGKILIYPTDTVYGLGCSISFPDSVKRVYEIKNRGCDKPLSVAFADLETARDYTVLDESSERYIKKHIREPLTFIVKKNERIPDTVTCGLETVGVRIPDHTLLRAVLEGTGPLITSSANLSGERAPSKIEEIDCEILDKADIVIDSGPCRHKTPSRVIDLASGSVLRD